MKRVLITGKNSYIGTNVEKWLMREPDKYYVESISVRGEEWKSFDFSKFDVVFHVAAIVHKKEKPRMKEIYFKVNRDLPVEVAKKSKKEGVLQFIFISTMAVYGEDGKLCQEVVINRDTPVNPKNLYATSKLKAEEEINELIHEKFRVVIIRPPMVYGPNCPGNHARLEKLAIKSPVFPFINNKRSMLHIDKLSQSVKFYIDNNSAGLYCPQNDEYINTSLMVKELSEKNGKSIYLSKSAGFIIKLIGKRSKLINRIFGNLVYER